MRPTGREAEETALNSARSHRESFSRIGNNAINQNYYTENGTVDGKYHSLLTEPHYCVASHTVRVAPQRPPGARTVWSHPC